MSSAHDHRADRKLSGSQLRNEAASYLSAIHGSAKIEQLYEGKKVDILCDVTEYGKQGDLFVEVKDYEGHLTRAEVVNIWADYSQIVARGRSGKLLLVTRRGLAPSAEAYIDSQPAMFHQTIWELEDAALGLMPYVKAQEAIFNQEGLSDYYIPARASLAQYDSDERRQPGIQDEALFEAVESWLDEEGAPPLAILGGYGAGKSSFAKRLISHQAARAIDDPAARRPILVRLGNITRSSGLDSLLGSLFTSEYEVRGYSFRRFIELNEKGRLLVVLDGFDEMKHAMTWTEFRNEISELNVLNSGLSKVILLGRPSAFTSDDEHVEVLRGKRRTLSGNRKIFNWPEFREFDLSPFSSPERKKFIELFLEYAYKKNCLEISKDVNENEIEERAKEVNIIADQEKEVFSKPVHAKILVELAIDPSFNLGEFAKKVTRWGLYSEFFGLLARRETAKSARSPIEADFRLLFLRRVALWLWRDKDGATSFRASELPKEILSDLPDGDSDSIEDKRREYLAGSFLERKSGDSYFFAHRSFAEFLVAEYLANSPPLATEHALYARLVRDGVAAFLSEAPSSEGIAAWSETLSDAVGALSLEYLAFLGNASGGQLSLSDKLGENSNWKPAISFLTTPLGTEDDWKAIIVKSLYDCSIPAVALLIYVVGLTGIRRPADAKEPDKELERYISARNQRITVTLVSALVGRLMSVLREPADTIRYTIDEKDAPLLRLAQQCIAIVRTENARFIEFDWLNAIDISGAMSRKANIAIDNIGEFSGGDTIRVAFGEVVGLIPAKLAQRFQKMGIGGRPFDAIAVVSKRL